MTRTDTALARSPVFQIEVDSAPFPMPGPTTFSKKHIVHISRDVEYVSAGTQALGIYPVEDSLAIRFIKSDWQDRGPHGKINIFIQLDLWVQICTVGSTPVTERGRSVAWDVTAVLIRGSERMVSGERRQRA